MVICFKAEHPLKVSLRTISTDIPIVAVVKEVQPEKADWPSVVTASGIVTEVMPVHPSKALLPISVSPLPSEMLVIPVQFWKAEFLIFFTLSGMVRSIGLVRHPLNRLSPITAKCSPKLSDPLMLVSPN